MEMETVDLWLLKEVEVGVLDSMKAVVVVVSITKIIEEVVEDEEVTQIRE